VLPSYREVVRRYFPTFCRVTNFRPVSVSDGLINPPERWYSASLHHRYESLEIRLLVDREVEMPVVESPGA